MKAPHPVLPVDLKGCTDEKLWRGIPERARSFLQAAPVCRSLPHADAFAYLLKLCTRGGNLVALVAPEGHTNNGTGKSTDLCELVMRARLTSRPVNARYMQLLDILRDVAGGKQERTDLRRWIDVPLLCIDELDKSGLSETGWVGDRLRRLFQELTDRRYSALRTTTIFATNRSEVDLRIEAGQSVCDRIAEAGGFIVTSWPAVRRFAVPIDQTGASR